MMRLSGPRATGALMRLWGAVAELSVQSHGRYLRKRFARIQALGYDLARIQSFGAS